jgi:transposase-like protein
MSEDQLRCLNPLCSEFNKAGGSNIIRASAIKTKHGETTRRWRCKTCNHIFSDTQDKFRYRLRAERGELRSLVIAYLGGSTISTLAEMLGRDTRTVSRWLHRLTQEQEDVGTFLQEECGLSTDQIAQFRKKYFSRRNTSPGS